MSDNKPHIDPYPLSPYAAWAGNRNKDAILHSFEELFPTKGDALEVATGAGLHINYLAPHFPNVRFQPSDYDQGVFETIKAKRLKGNNIADPALIDLTVSSTWPNADERFYDVIFVINIFHVASLSIAEGIAALGAELLKPSGFIAIYGPFKLDGKYTTPSNEAFDREIRAAGVPEWGLKDVRDIERETRTHGLALKRQLDVPASNFILLFGRS
ncbi:DUF938 domain-containing protein [Bradyrhizobium mercantei]|uniref:DUF938 domain-containing protein n=1 Tax=Bradyrhizobium mercantei TaxID=1904807 RepID=UPI001FD89C4D|nr:DUF938 domain-containing protein [Bradyrhizobium mercantei]